MLFDENFEPERSAHSLLDVGLISKPSFEVLRNSVIEFINSKSNRGVVIRFVNAYSLSLAYQDIDYWSCLSKPGTNFIDGLPVAFFISLKYGQIHARLRGATFFRQALSLEDQNVTHMLVGTTTETLDHLNRKIQKDFPHSKIVCSYAPPYFERTNENEVAKIMTKINLYQPTFTWIALGTPKQDYVCNFIAERTKTIAVGIGAAFDFVAGTKPEAPRLLQKLGLEWMFRLVNEPARLWRRYLVGNLIFLGATLTELLMGTKKPRE